METSANPICVWKAAERWGKLPFPWELRKVLNNSSSGTNVFEPGEADNLLAGGFKELAEPWHTGSF